MTANDDTEDEYPPTIHGEFLGFESLLPGSPVSAADITWTDVPGEVTFSHFVLYDNAEPKSRLRRIIWKLRGRPNRVLLTGELPSEELEPRS